MSPDTEYCRHIHQRSTLVLLIVILGFIGLGFRLAWIQLIEHEEYKKQALQQHWVKKELPAKRGTIYDRNRQILAISIPCFSCYADPKMITNPQKVAQELQTILQLDESFLLRQLSDPRRRFVWIKRFLSDEQTQMMQAMRIPGIFFLPESKRCYPQGKLAAHVIGFVGLDQNGLEGIEAVFQKQLAGQDGATWVLKDGRKARWNIHSFEAQEQPPQNGLDVILTIDIRLQEIVEEELANGMEKYQAKFGAVVLLSAKTSEVLAMASYPTFDPNCYMQSPVETWRNHAIADAYELGSVMKPFTIAAALSEKIVTEETVIFCNHGKCRILPQRVLHDTHGYGDLSVAEVLVHSSNIGTVKVGMMLGKEKLADSLHQVGFGQKTGIELPGETIGILKPAPKWTDFTLTSVPMGHEICATPIQMATAYATLANDGQYRRPTLLRELQFPNNTIWQPPIQPPRLVYQPSISSTLRPILRAVVQRGTAQKANIKGVEIAGKTGTAQKLVNGQYSHSNYLSVFAGFAPFDDPDLCAIVMLDEPQGAYYGGTVAAPVIANTFKRSLYHRENTTTQSP